MSHIFVSHSSANNAEAISLRDWLVAEGWSELFLDPDRDIAARLALVHERVDARAPAQQAQCI